MSAPRKRTNTRLNAQHSVAVDRDSGQILGAVNAANKPKETPSAVIDEIRFAQNQISSVRGLLAQLGGRLSPFRLPVDPLPPSGVAGQVSPAPPTSPVLLELQYLQQDISTLEKALIQLDNSITV